MNKQDFIDTKNKAVEALLRIGRGYETGNGVGKDEAEAVNGLCFHSLKILFSHVSFSLS